MKMQGSKIPSLSNMPEFSIQVSSYLLQCCQLREQTHPLLQAMLTFLENPGSVSFSRPNVLCAIVFYFTETVSLCIAAWP